MHMRHDSFVCVTYMRERHIHTHMPHVRQSTAMAVRVHIAVPTELPTCIHM